MFYCERLAWPLHKDDTLFQSGRPTGLNIYFAFLFLLYILPKLLQLCHIQLTLHREALLLFNTKF